MIVLVSLAYHIISEGSVNKSLPLQYFSMIVKKVRNF